MTVLWEAAGPRPPRSAACASVAVEEAVPRPRPPRTKRRRFRTPAPIGPKRGAQPVPPLYSFALVVDRRLAPRSAPAARCSSGWSGPSASVSVTCSKPKGGGMSRATLIASASASLCSSRPIDISTASAPATIWAIRASASTLVMPSRTHASATPNSVFTSREANAKRRPRLASANRLCAPAPSHSEAKTLRISHRSTGRGGADLRTQRADGSVNIWPARLRKPRAHPHQPIHHLARHQRSASLL